MEGQGKIPLIFLIFYFFACLPLHQEGLGVKVLA